MHSESKLLLKKALQKCLPELQSFTNDCATSHKVWTKTSENTWHGEFVLQPNLNRMFMLAHKSINEIGRDFAESFFAHHPEYKGLVGVAGASCFNLGHDIAIYTSLIMHTWQQFKTFDLQEYKIDLLVNEFEQFVDNPKVRFVFCAELLNFKATTDSIELPEGLRIRRMTENEISASYGGPIETLDSVRSALFGLHEFCIEGEIDEPKSFGELQGDLPLPQDRAKLLLDRVILALRTFKSGQVGYDTIRFRPLNFCPVPMPSYIHGNLYVPFGDYTISENECLDLQSHTKLIIMAKEPSMEMALSRLADAETRLKPQDRLVDSVIGMEALLLAGLSKEDRKGELKFRFSLHYSTMYQRAAERLQAFRVAKDLYDLRSTVAHGSTLGDTKIRVGSEKLTLSEAASKASETLRTVVRYFLPKASEAPYKKHEFWENAYFGLSVNQ
jgi:hypothetical protein